jgi:hypothetical protein
MADSHPLFPAASEDTDPPEVQTIHVTRVPDGTHFRAFGPDELTSLEQIYQMFGGGQYTLLARNASHITARVAYTLPGKSKPMNPEPQEEPHLVPAPPAAAPPQQTSDNFFLGMMQMMQANTTAMMQMMQAQSAKQTELMIAVMGQGSSGAREHIQAMQALHDRHAEEQNKLMQAMLETARGSGQAANGSGQMDGFVRGLEFAREYATGGGADDELSEIFSSLAPFLAGANNSVEGSGNVPPAE